MSAVLNTTNRRRIRDRIAAYFKAIYVRRKIASHEFDVANLVADLEQMPERIDHHDKRIAELRVELALLEKV